MRLRVRSDPRYSPVEAVDVILTDPEGNVEDIVTTLLPQRLEIVIDAAGIARATLHCYLDTIDLEAVTELVASKTTNGEE